MRLLISVTIFENGKSKIAKKLGFPQILSQLAILGVLNQKLFENEYAKLLAHNDIRDYRYNNAF